MKNAFTYVPTIATGIFGGAILASDQGFLTSCLMTALVGCTQHDINQHIAQNKLIDNKASKVTKDKIDESSQQEHLLLINSLTNKYNTIGLVVGAGTLATCVMTGVLVPSWLKA